MAAIHEIAAIPDAGDAAAATVPALIVGCSRMVQPVPI
jgi:hypothetical protein